MEMRKSLMSLLGVSAAMLGSIGNYGHESQTKNSWGKKRKYPKKPYNKNHKNRTSSVCAFSAVGDSVAFREPVKCRESKQTLAQLRDCVDNFGTLRTHAPNGKKWFKCKQTGLYSVHSHITREEWSERVAKKLRRAG
jgi:hypothetical protein